MRTSHHQQALSYDIRLPDDAQADALRLLAASRAVVNATLTQLWLSLNEFTGERAGPAWKHVVALLPSPDPHGNRQWRCEAETAGRILRAMAQRKQIFQLLAPILSDGFIRPKTQTRPAGKQRASIKAALTALQQQLTSAEDESISFVVLQNVIEQCCNFFLKEGSFPRSFEELQPIPLLSVGLLTFAGDDGPTMGQSYKLALHLSKDQESATVGTAELLLRYPNEQGQWQWRETPTVLTLPTVVCERLKTGHRMAPTLREHVCPDGTIIAVLDFILEVPKARLPEWKEVERVLGFDWGVHTLLTMTVIDEHSQQVARPWFLQTDGLDDKQARTRCQIDQIKAKQERVGPGHPKYALYGQEIERCWRKYEARNHELAHVAANVMLLLANVYECRLISGESLSTLKTIGRGKGAKGKWRNWRNNTTIRSDIFRILRYKCHLLGIRFRCEHPRGTSHTCPRCCAPARTFRSPHPAHRQTPIDWGRWLICEHCGYNADRDYCAAQNIARLGVAYLLQVRTTKKAWSFTMTDESVKATSYTGVDSMLRLPSTTRTSRSHEGEETSCYPGWIGSVTLCSSYPTDVVQRLCG